MPAPVPGGLFEENLTYTIVGGSLEVARALGHGLHEKPYENALVIELGLRGLHVNQQAKYDLFYKNILVGNFVPDLVIDSKIIVDTKVIERISNHERGQMLNYLRITKLRIGLLINFQHPKLEWERLIL